MQDLTTTHSKPPITRMGKFAIYKTGLVMDKNATYEEWYEFINKALDLNCCTQWVIGDGLNLGESNWGEMYSQALDEKGSSYQTLRDDKWVSSKVKLSRRRDNLSFAHHREVAPLEPNEQDELLDLAEQGDGDGKPWSEKRLRQEIRRRKSPKIAARPAGDCATSVICGDMLSVVPELEPFDLVVADPPYNVTEWDWDKFGTPSEFLDSTRLWLETVQGVLKPEYNLFWFCSPKFSADIEMVLRELCLPIKSRIVWHRRNMSMGSDARDKFIDTWEMVFHCGTKPLNFPEEWHDDRFDVQIHSVPQTNYTDTKLHVTQKPLELIKRLVEYGSLPGERVLDPFAGSGTTGEACSGTRNCTLVELEDEYVNIIERRLGITRQLQE